MNRMPSEVARAIAKAFLAGQLDPRQMAARGSIALGRQWYFLKPLARRIHSQLQGKTRPPLASVVTLLQSDAGLIQAMEGHSRRVKVVSWLTGPQKMQPASAVSAWPVPPFETPAELAGWLQLTLSELEWFADLKHYLRRPRVPAGLRHYHYRILQKRSGGQRLIEAPKPRLKAIQQKILAHILSAMRPHNAAHGFRRGRSIRSFTAPHAGQQAVLKMDLEDFFPSIQRARVQALFRTAGYPEAVANLLGGLCTAVTPREILNNAAYSIPHLPQGAPTSPALANLCGYRVDSRLRALAHSAGAEYTRYADDLAFSGGTEFERSAERFSALAASILKKEGFSVNHRKTRIMRQGVRQQLTGLVVNMRPNIRRSDYDGLKAILTNCERGRPGEQNRDKRSDFRAHLSGRVSFVESINPGRGAKLRAIYNRIDWTLSD